MSDQLSNLAPKLAEALLSLFEGDEQAALNWLCTPCPALGNETPADAIKNASPEGSNRVLAVVTRLEYGVHQ